ncbi:MAG: hypothetical protein NC922_01940 [Candidatus Omnitrophica bacterium]|nr:hypothetical protein [Candidatus Omnitrophota bacterium]
MKKFKICAHRGFSWEYPENTVLSFQKAVELGVDEIEMDVKFSKDKVPVILHDERVDRTTDGTGYIWDLTLKEIKKLNAGKEKKKVFRGVKIPTLEEAIEVIPVNTDINLHTWTDEKLVEEVIKILIEKDKIKNTYLAISSSLIKLARKLYPEIRICNMSRQFSNPEEYIEETVKWKAERLQFFTPSYEITENLVEKAHSYGIIVNVFYANDENMAEKYIKMGVDVILTDRPDLLLNLRKEKDEKYNCGRT